MSAQKLRFYISFALYTIICMLVIMFQSTGLLSLQIKTASAVLVLPLVIYGGFYFGEYCGAVLGLLSGAVTDVYSSTLVYNTVMLMICGFFAGIVISRLFNRNFAAACVLNILGSVLYFFAKWIIVYAFIDPEPVFILTKYLMPSNLYTAVLGIVLFFLLDVFLKKIPLSPTKR